MTGPSFDNNGFSGVRQAPSRVCLYGSLTLAYTLGEWLLLTIHRRLDRLFFLEGMKAALEDSKRPCAFFLARIHTGHNQGFSSLDGMGTI